ncbi:MAG: hypothetical protein ACR2P7_07250, partial [bacterium]
SMAMQFESESELVEANKRVLVAGTLLANDQSMQTRLASADNQTTRELLTEIGLADVVKNIPQEVVVKVVLSTESTFYIPINKVDDQGFYLDHNALSMVNAAGMKVGSASTVGCAGSLSTTGSICTTIGTASCVSTASSAGSVSPS